MITGDKPSDGRIRVYVQGVDRTTYFVSANIRTGGNMMPYRCEPDIGSATANFYFKPGVTVPTTFVPGSELVLEAQGALSYVTVFRATIADVTRTAELNEATGTYGTQVSLYALDIVAQLNQIDVPGVITSSSTKNQTWEQRITTTLGPYFPAGSALFPSTGTEAHVYRLVDNNVNGTLVDQINLACNSVGATWYVDTDINAVKFQARGVYGTSGALFTDEPGYWTSSNKPAKAGSITAYNLQYKTLEMSFDTRNLVNALTTTNIMPRNMITRPDTGALVYKDPGTTKVDVLEVLEPTYTGVNSASVTTYGRRPGELTTNVYPYRTSDTDSWYVRFNTYLDPNIEYKSDPQVTCTNANVRFSTTTPYNGTYCLDLVTTAGGSSYQFILGDPNGYLFKTFPVVNRGAFGVAFRTAQSNARIQRGVQYLDSNGTVLLTQTAAVQTPTLNTWQIYDGNFMDYTTIPAAAVSWRPFIIVSHATGSFTTGTTIGKLDAIGINPIMDTPNQVDGDDPDTGSWLNSWDGEPGNSYSYRIRNVIDNITSDALTYLKEGGLAPRYLEWNARENWDQSYRFSPGDRIDVRFNGTNYTAWIDRIEWEITTDDAILKLDLSRRPSSWA